MAAEASTPGVTDDVPALWRPASGWLSLLRAVHWVYLAGLLIVAARWGGGAHGMLPGLVVAASGLMVAFAVHEGGNYAAARASGMVVLLVRFGSIELQPLRKGWRVRWRTPAYGGRYTLIYPVPDPDRSLRGATIALGLGGPVATIVLSSFVALGLAIAPYPSTHALFVTALCASMTPLVYLFPSFAGSEGIAIEVWRWWRHPPDATHLRSVLANARLVWGTPASLFSDAELDALGSGIPMNRLWYAVKAAQQRGEWFERGRLQEEWNAAIPTNLRVRAILAEITALAEAELKWMDAVQNRDALLLPDEADIRSSRWINPGLALRSQAVRAWLEGDSAGVATATGATLALAGTSQDRSLLESERLILRALAATPR
jgi:hypothetical protein